ncbi:hypothetical protein DFQ30_004236 [Apophysomyces sp. BC1015]|nr:hypothetical protein DFQ30_004236 [Apophysomyces sp. BC1015]
MRADHSKHDEEDSCYFSQLRRNYEHAVDPNTLQGSEAKVCEYETNPPDMILSAALEQFDTATAHSLYELAIQLLRKNNPMQAWECYTDITSRNMLRYLSRDQFRQLIAQFNHKASYAEALEYVITLVEDMKSFQHRVGIKEKFHVMRLLGMNGKLKEMEAVFEDINSDPATGDVQKHFNIMLTAYQHQVNTVGRKRVAEKSMEIYNTMLDQGLRPAPAASRLLMENVRAGGNSDTMVEIVWGWFCNSINTRTVDLEPSLYRDLVMFFASAGRAEYALEINDIMTKNGVKRDLRMMTALIHKVGRSGDVGKAMDLFNEMVNVEDCQPNIVTFNALIDIHAHKRPLPDFEGANRIYAMLHEMGLKANVRTFGTLIDMFAKEGDITTVRRLYKDMTANSKIVANPHIFSSLMECFIKNNDRESAISVLRILRSTSPHGVKPTEAIYNILIRSFIRDDDPKSAFELFNLMKKAGLTPDAMTFSPLLSYYADRGDAANAQIVARHMSSKNVEPSPHTYTILLEAYAKANDLEGAERVFRQSKQRWRPNAYAFNSLLYGYAKMNETDKIFDTYKSMLKTYIKADQFTYGILMYYFSKRKEVKAVESLLDTMHAHGVVPGVNCWTILMHTYFKCGLAEEGRQAMERMVQAGVKPNYVTLSILVKGLLSADKVDAAESVINKAIDRVTEQRRGGPLEQIKKAYPDRQPLADITTSSTITYERDLPTTIEDLLDSQRSSQPVIEIPPPHLFDPLINAYRKRGDCEMAKELFRKMRDLGVTISEGVYVSLMKVFMHSGQHDIVALMWDHMRRPAAEMNIPEIGLVPYPSIQSSAKLLALNEDLCFEPPETSHDISSFSLSVYVDSLAMQGCITDIEQLWEKLTEEKFSFDEQSWNRYIVALIQGGKLAKACQVANEQFLAIADETDQVKRVVRSGDDLPATTDTHLHTRTCRAFAEALEVPGAEGMGNTLLKISVNDCIREYIHKEHRFENDVA